MAKPTAADIDAVLPQTQCQLCQYEGCRPYAEAIVQARAPIDRCLPGGVTVLDKLSELTGRVTSEDARQILAQTTKSPSVAVIDETQCIGCTKCIQVCPVQAISGAAKLMHTIIEAECTGCDLCLPACPMDCIEVVPLAEANFDPERARMQHEKRTARLATRKNLRRQPNTPIELASSAQKNAFIEAARTRAKQKQTTWTPYEQTSDNSDL